MVLSKIFRKAERRYLNDILEVDKISEQQLLSSHLTSKKIHYLTYHRDEDKGRHKDLIDTNYYSLKDQLQLIKHKRKYSFSQVGGSRAL
jgi:hypothetical protein